MSESASEIRNDRAAEHGSSTGERLAERIVVGVDGSPGSAAALHWALDEGLLRQVPVHVVLSWMMPALASMTPLTPPDADLQSISRQELDGLLRTEAGDLGRRSPRSPVTTAVLEGGAATQLLAAAAEGASLLVVGSRGHGGFAGLLLGSVSQQCAAHAPCPVVVVHGDRHI